MAKTKKQKSKKPKASQNKAGDIETVFLRLSAPLRDTIIVALQKSTPSSGFTVEGINAICNTLKQLPKLRTKKKI